MSSQRCSARCSARRLPSYIRRCAELPVHVSIFGAVQALPRRIGVADHVRSGFPPGAHRRCARANVERDVARAEVRDTGVPTATPRGPVRVEVESPERRTPRRVLVPAELAPVRMPADRAVRAAGGTLPSRRFGSAPVRPAQHAMARDVPRSAIAPRYHDLQQEHVRPRAPFPPAQRRAHLSTDLRSGRCLGDARAASLTDISYDTATTMLPVGAFSRRRSISRLPGRQRSPKPSRRPSRARGRLPW